MVICLECCRVYDNESIPVICCDAKKTLMPVVVCQPKDVSRKMVAAVEQICGMGSGAWDTIDPAEIVAAAITVGNCEA